MERIDFLCDGDRLVGDLHLPQGAGPFPAVVVTGAWFTVKEQMPTRYARELAARGIAALAFDFRGFGESGGAVRQRENPSAKIADILAAVSALAARPNIDPGRIGGLGICASAGYMAAAANRSATIRALALVAPWLHDADIVAATYGGAEGVAGLIATGRAAEAAYQTSGRQVFQLGASATDPSAVMFGVPYYTEPTRGLIPAWRNEIDPAFWEGWLTFDAIAEAPGLRTPLAVVHSPAAAIPVGTRRFLERRGLPVEELWLDGVTQFDFYDRDDAVTRAADSAAAHFTSRI